MLKQVRSTRRALESRRHFHAAASCRVCISQQMPRGHHFGLVIEPRSAGFCFPIKVVSSVCKRGVHSTTMTVVMAWWLEAAPFLAARVCVCCCCDLLRVRACVCTHVYSIVPYVIRIRPHKQHQFRSNTAAAILSTLHGPESPFFHKVSGPLRTCESRENITFKCMQRSRWLMSISKVNRIYVTLRPVVIYWLAM